ncbi:hypothetical protein [Amycolatopsis magusensis]|uniref:hypothetical protein n=1 Tax=Amycolatopsis magusensis TaxID=882444 RepID=UPI0037AB89BB
MYGARRQRDLDKVADTVAHAAPHTAHETLVRAAWGLGRLVAGGEFTDDEARATLHIAAQQRRIPTGFLGHSYTANPNTVLTRYAVRR